MESKSLLYLEPDKIAFSIVKNIGIGFDGRDNTLYNHTIILEKNQFEKLNSDSRTLSNYFIEKPTERGTLDKISIKEDKLPINWNFFEKIPRSVLEFVLDSVFSKKKIALVGISQNEFIPELISILPLSIRQISYSNAISDPQRQSRYDLIQIIENDKSFSFDNFEKIDVPELMPFYKNDEDVFLERSVKFFVEILKSKNASSLEFIHKEFDEIKTSDIKNKLKLTTYYEQIRNETDENKCQKFATDILEFLDYFDDETAVKYLIRIKKFLPEKDYRKYSLQLETGYIISEFINKPINFENITKMFNSLRIWNTESRTKLLTQLIKNRTDEVKKNGTQILLDSRSSYPNIIMDVFIEHEFLYPCILEIFSKKTDLAPMYKQDIFASLISKSIKLKINLVITLLKISAFDLYDEYDSRHYKQVLKNVFENSEFINQVNKELILEVIKENFSRIKSVAEYKPTSGTSGTTDSNLRELNDIIMIFIESLDHFTESKDISIDLQEEIKNEIKLLQSFLEEHKVKPKPLWHLWD